jgi:hypothetical protein
LLNAVSPTETHEGLMAVNSARMAGVKRIVYLSVADLEKAPHLPHFGSKMAIEHVIKTSGIAYTILRPNNFFQNDCWFKEALMVYGVYPQPHRSPGQASGACPQVLRGLRRGNPENIWPSDRCHRPSGPSGPTNLNIGDVKSIFLFRSVFIAQKREPT